ncbi:MAG TPA: class I SAM-dependent methyltransferase [Blastocatellia bacterium]|nr:class I SAM-dependent methyltransferase [Blastocatellia bacterium]
MFDRQASVFDQRAWLPVDCCRLVAGAVLEIAEVAPGDLIFEIGAGTGRIGRHFGTPSRYLGLDLSAGMLNEYQRSDALVGDRMLVRADANEDWPLAGGVARVVFSSRTLHRLDHNHVATEVNRVASPAGATLLIGRVKRERDSVRKRMSAEMREQLRLRGFHGRGVDHQDRELIEACLARGWEVREPISVAKWNVASNPRQSLDSWRQVQGLAGIDVPDATRLEILADLEAWAGATFGGLDQTVESEESYVLKPILIRPAHPV